MPAISLVVCVYRQRDLLERLMREAQGCHDDLVVVHDGPDIEGIKSQVEQSGGRFFQQPRAFQEEPHWPFAWAQTRHDWILKMDADEFPGEDMKIWLKQFRAAAEPAELVSAFTCIWPLWDGEKAVTAKWPRDRMFLFHKQRVTYFALGEQVPIPEMPCKSLSMTLHHQPKRRSLGLRNVLFRRQAYAWRAVIARSLLGRPTDLPCWRWTSASWPIHWEQIRAHPFRTAIERLTLGTLRSLRDQWRIEGRLLPTAAINGGIHHALICLEYWRQRRNQKRS
jgi:hypothetical protein